MSLKVIGTVLDLPLPCDLLIQMAGDRLSIPPLARKRCLLRHYHLYHEYPSNGCSPEREQTLTVPHLFSRHHARYQCAHDG